MPVLRTEYITPLNDDDRKVAKEDLGENSTQVQSQIQSLREAVKQMKHLIIPDDDEFLLGFLRHAKFSQLRALTVLDKFTKNRLTNPCKQLFMNEAKLPSNVDETLKRGVVFYTPGVVIIRAEVWDTAVVSLEDILQTVVLIFELALRDPSTQVHGLNYLHDYHGATMSQLAQFTPSRASMGNEALSNGFPMRFRGIHFYRGPMLLNGIISVMKSIMRSKMAERLFTHSDEQSLHTKIDPKSLPEEMGGSAGTCQELAERWHKHVKQHVTHFQKYSCVSYDESRKVGQLEGTFRKLNVD